MRYCTLITGELKQESPMSYGGNRPHDQVDLPFARDGQGRPVLRGSALAGIFIHQARRLNGGHLPRSITLPCDQKPDERDKRSSCWRFEHAHLLDKNQARPLQFHQHVSIHPDTGASRDDHLFSLEAVPAGSRWGFVMSVWPNEQGQIELLEDLALRLLRHWLNEGCRLGRGTGHGYGWMRLENVRIWRLDRHHAAIWPNALEELDTPQKIERYLSENGVHGESLAQSSEAVSERTLLRGCIQVGMEEDGYGLNSLSIGTHAQLGLQTDWMEEKVLGLRKGFSFEPDFIIHTEPASHGQQRVPVIPGSAIRGVLRAAMARWKTQLGIGDNCIDWLFGTTEKAGALKVANAYLKNDKSDNWKLLWQQHVAIDEFSGGAYEGAKFDRLALIHAQFDFHLRIEPAQGTLHKPCIDALKRLIETLGGAGQLPLGGGVWKGHGWVRWRLQKEACDGRS